MDRYINVNKRDKHLKFYWDFLGSAMCSNGLFAIVAESGNFVIWDIEERRILFTQQLKGIFQFLLHTAETMVGILQTGFFPSKKILFSSLGYRSQFRNNHSYQSKSRIRRKFCDSSRYIQCSSNFLCYTRW